MRFLILGSAGMLGQALVKEAKKRNIEFFDADKHNATFLFDVTNDSELIDLIHHTKPTVIINTIAIVDHNECETNKTAAYTVNSRPAGILAQLAQQLHFYFVQISTDHFYTQDSDKKHLETDSVELLNEYARTKYAAECFALINPKALVVRTNIVGFRNDPNNPTFVEWAINSIINDSNMMLFEDYFTSSIDVKNFSKILFDVIDKKISGIINIANREVFSKKMFILKLAQKLNRKLNNTATGSVSSLKNNPRAESLGLDVSIIESILKYRMPTLNQTIESLICEHKGKNNEIQ